MLYRLACNIFFSSVIKIKNYFSVKPALKIVSNITENKTCTTRKF